MDCRSLGVRELECGWDPFTYEGRIFATRTVHAALDMGINYFTTAHEDGEGYAESLLGQALAKRRHDVILATRLRCRRESAGEILDRIVSCLRRLRTNYLDIVQIDRTDAAGDDGYTDLVDTLLRMRDQGIIGYFGLTDVDPQDDSGMFSVAQLCYDTNDQGGTRSAMDWCRQRDIGISIANPKLSGSVDDSVSQLKPTWSLIDDSDEFRLKFLLSDRRVHSISVGMRWEHEVHMNASLVGSAHQFARSGKPDNERKRPVRPAPLPIHPADYPVRAPA